MWSIENQCPQCGSPVALEETDRIFNCPFCRVRLYITSGDHLEYYLPAANAPGRLAFIPYWRLKGIAFSAMAFEIRSSIVDGNILACDCGHLQRTIGLRPQALKLKFVSAGIDADFIKPGLTFKEAALRIGKELEAVESELVKAQPAFFKTFIGESAGLIYVPVYVKDKGLYDAILGSPLSQLAMADVEGLLTSGTHEAWQAKFISTLCPECGHDLEGDRKSMVLFCNSCFSAWQEFQGSLGRIAFGIAPNKDGDVSYLPFWRIKAEFDGLKLRSYADLVRTANLPKVIKEEWESLDCRFWVPAFKTNPPLFLRLSRELTILNPQTEFAGQINLTDPYPVTLPAGEAVESVRITLANITARKKDIFPVLPGINVRAAESLLVYLPFVSKGPELIHPEMGFSIQKNALLMGSNL